MRPAARFLAGVAVGGAALAGYLTLVGFDTVSTRVTAVTWATVAVVVAFVVAEGLADGIGVWASVRPLGEGLSPGRSVQFALAGDFFDKLSPAGPVTSEPIMARFIGVATETTYSEALGVRSVAKYVKSAAQVGFSTLVGLVLVAGGPVPRSLVATLGGVVVAVLVGGVALVRFRGAVTWAAVRALTPVITRVSRLYREEPHDRAAVEAGLERFWSRTLAFRRAPGLLALIVVGGVVEQVLTATALWVALAGTGASVGSGAALLALVVVVPLPQVASVVPVPASLGTYDVLLGGAIALSTGASAATAAAAVLVVRTATIAFAITTGGLAVAFLRGWRP